jgi:hypothetical protein
MPTCSNRGVEISIGRESYGKFNIFDAAALQNRAGAAIDHAVPDLARRFVAGTGGRDDFAAKMAP